MYCKLLGAKAILIFFLNNIILFRIYFSQNICNNLIFYFFLHSWTCYLYILHTFRCMMISLNAVNTVITILFWTWVFQSIPFLYGKCFTFINLIITFLRQFLAVFYRKFWIWLQLPLIFNQYVRHWLLHELYFILLINFMTFHWNKQTRYIVVPILCTWVIT